MAPLRFRAWDRKEKEMISVAMEITNVGFGDGSLVVDDRTQRGNELDWMQSTGLTDKNGKEIFEGDVVKAKSYGEEITFKIKWIGMTGCGCHNGYGFGIPDENDEPDEWEVIGNIYSDPHLLR